MDISWLDGFLLSMPGATKDFKEEWQWTRYQVGGKLFAAVCKGDSGEDELVTLKLEPQEGAFLREQYEDILPGYYMNKTHWNSVRIAGEIPEELLRHMAQESYRLVFTSLTKRAQREISEGNNA